MCKRQSQVKYPIVLYGYRKWSLSTWRRGMHHLVATGQDILWPTAPSAPDHTYTYTALTHTHTLLITSHSIIVFRPWRPCEGCGRRTTMAGTLSFEECGEEIFIGGNFNQVLVRFKCEFSQLSISEERRKLKWLMNCNKRRGFIWSVYFLQRVYYDPI